MASGTEVRVTYTVSGISTFLLPTNFHSLQNIEETKGNDIKKLNYFFYFHQGKVFFVDLCDVC